MTTWKTPAGNFRKHFYTATSNVHPAKMSPWLCARIFDHGREMGYWRPGDLILDFMMGIGTTLIEGILRGYNVIGVELEEKYCKLAQDCIELVQSKASNLKLGKAHIIHGDARNLNQLLQEGRAVISSPPFGDMNHPTNYLGRQKKESCAEYSNNKENIGNLNYGAAISSPPYGPTQSGGGIAKDGYTGNKHSPTDLVGKRSYMPENVGSGNNISNLPYAAISSPPYSETIQKKGGETTLKNIGISSKTARQYSPNPNNIGNLSHGAICSPPYGNQVSGEKEGTGQTSVQGGWKKGIVPTDGGYSDNPKNIGNFPRGAVSSPEYGNRLADVKIEDNDPTRIGYKQSGAKDNLGTGQSYLTEMLKVYQQVYQVLQPDGICCLVTKNFIRNKEIVWLDKDTIQLMQMAGFQLIERVKAKLPGKSFWKTLYEQKYPEVPKIDHEDVLFFRKI